MSGTSITIAFQGALGAYSHLACREVFPDAQAIPCDAFEDVFAAVANGSVDYGMIPIENSLAGRVADIHTLMPVTKLFIIKEHFLKIHHHLLALPDARLEDIRFARSHIHALGQCRAFMRDHKIRPVVAGDTAGAAAELAGLNDHTIGAIASSLAGEIYGLRSLAANIEDAAHNTTRFLVLSREDRRPAPDAGLCVTTFVFRVRNVPSALYKAMGGFATNGVNMTKLESYQMGGTFTATQFYADVEGHPDQPNVARALDELAFFSHEVHVLGVYPAHSYRLEDHHFEK